MNHRGPEFAEDFDGGTGFYLSNLFDVDITIINHPFGNGLFIPTIYGDDWGMVYHCYTHISWEIVGKSAFNRHLTLW